MFVGHSISFQADLHCVSLSVASLERMMKVVIELSLTVCEVTTRDGVF